MGCGAAFDGFFPVCGLLCCCFVLCSLSCGYECVCRIMALARTGRLGRVGIQHRSWDIVKRKKGHSGRMVWSVYSSGYGKLIFEDIRGWSIDKILEELDASK